MIIGISGKMDSGKTTIAKEISNKYGFKILSTHIFLANKLVTMGVEPNRDNLQELGKEIINDVGGEGLMDLMLQDIYVGNYIIDSIRHESALLYLQRKYSNQYFHIHIKVDDNLRYNRRKKNTGENSSLTQYITYNKASTEREIDQLEKFADLIVINNESIENTNKIISNTINSFIEIN